MMVEKYLSSLYVDPNGTIKVSTAYADFLTTLPAVERPAWRLGTFVRALGDKIEKRTHNGRPVDFLIGYSVTNPDAPRLKAEEAARAEAERQAAARAEVERQEAERREAERQEAERREAKRREAERVLAAYNQQLDQAHRAALDVLNRRWCQLIQQHDGYFFKYVRGAEISFSELAAKIGKFDDIELTAEDARVILLGNGFFADYVTQTGLKDTAWRPEAIRANGELKMPTVFFAGRESPRPNVMYWQVFDGIPMV